MKRRMWISALAQICWVTLGKLLSFSLSKHTTGRAVQATSNSVLALTVLCALQEVHTTGRSMSL